MKVKTKIMTTILSRVTIVCLALMSPAWAGGGEQANLAASDANDLEAKIYWTDTLSKEIQCANLDGSGVIDLAVIPVSLVFGIALDDVGGKMYWTDAFNDKIQRANLDGSYVEDLITTNLKVPYSIAVDSVNSKIYWTDSNASDIKRANLDGSSIETVIGGISVPKCIALDNITGKIYWTSYTKIQRANFDGSEVEDIVVYPHWAPEGIALDVTGGKMYWLDNYNNMIRSANLDGSGITDLVQGLVSPRNITLDLYGGKMIWTDVDAGMIQSANLDGTDVTNLITGIHPFGIAIHQPNIEIEVEVEVKLTPQILSCESQGNWLKAHVTFPEEIFPEDIDVNTPAVADPPGVESEFIVVNEYSDGYFDVQIYFDRQTFCDALSDTEDGLLEVTVTGSLTDGRKFQGSDTIKLKSKLWQHRIRRLKRQLKK